MTATEIKNRINALCSHFTFEYNGKACGIDPISHTRFEMWCGDDTFIAKSIDEVMDTSIFDGKALKDIPQNITLIDI